MIQQHLQESRVKVEIIILSYQQEDLLPIAIESVLQQKTTFPFRLIIADDGSSDHSVALVHGFQKRYPGKIKLVTAEQNGGGLVNVVRAMETLCCEYFAVLDGDDFWVTEDKLQKQVDFLEHHPEYSCCGGQTTYLVNEEPHGNVIADMWLGKRYTFADAFQRPILIHTSSLLYRNVVFSPYIPNVYYDVIETFENCALRGEDFRRLVHLEAGPCMIFPDVFSAYRIHAKGVWSGKSEVGKAIESGIGAHFFVKYFTPRHPDLAEDIARYAASCYQNMWKVLIEKNHVYPSYQLDAHEGKLLSAFLDDLNKEAQRHRRLRKSVSR